MLVDECDDLNLIFNHWIREQRPMIAAKVATTLDGRIATRLGESRWITADNARADVMRWRRLFPAIAVGAGTILHDGPRLTARIEGAAEWCPVRFVFDRMLRTAAEHELPAVYTDRFWERTIVIASERAGTGYARHLENKGVKVWMLPGAEARDFFAAFRARCAAEQITGVLVEGGERLLSALLQAREIDYLFAYRAPLLFADARALPFVDGLRTESLDQAIRLERVRHAVFGDDQLLRGVVSYPGKLFPDEAAR